LQKRFSNICVFPPEVGAIKQNDVGAASKGSPYSHSTLSDAPPYTVMLRSLLSAIYSNRAACLRHALRPSSDGLLYDVALLVFDHELARVCSADICEAAHLFVRKFSHLL
jgi:hypothetical protein